MDQGQELKFIEMPIMKLDSFSTRLEIRLILDHLLKQYFLMILQKLSNSSSNLSKMKSCLMRSLVKNFVLSPVTTL